MGFVTLASFHDTLSISHKKTIDKSFFSWEIFQNSCNLFYGLQCNFIFKVVKNDEHWKKKNDCIQFCCTISKCTWLGKLSFDCLFLTISLLSSKQKWCSMFLTITPKWINLSKKRLVTKSKLLKFWSQLCKPHLSNFIGFLSNLTLS